MTIDTEDLRHTYGLRVDGVDRCPLCPGEHGGPGPCDLRKDSRRRRQFDNVPWHREELLNALLNPDRSAASAVMERREIEYRTRPSGHLCSCICPNVQHGRQSCDECRRLHQNEKPLIPIEIGRTAAVSAPMPDASTLDLLLGIL